MSNDMYKLANKFFEWAYREHSEVYEDAEQRHRYWITEDDDYAHCLFWENACDFERLRGELDDRDKYQGDIAKAMDEALTKGFSKQQVYDAVVKASTEEVTDIYRGNGELYMTPLGEVELYITLSREAVDAWLAEQGATFDELAKSLSWQLNDHNEDWLDFVDTVPMDYQCLTISCDPDDMFTELESIAPDTYAAAKERVLREQREASEAAARLEADAVRSSANVVSLAEFRRRRVA
jgi:hypothetical protein